MTKRVINACFIRYVNKRLYITKSYGDSLNNAHIKKLQEPEIKEKNDKIASVYKSKDIEARWLNFWNERGYFSPLKNTTQSFSMILPPPNVTGSLHLGHALTISIQDVLARWQRMLGNSVLWVPGTDHAGIATQVVVEKKLWQEERQTRHSMGRDRFVEEIWKWKHDKGMCISKQLKSMGASLDWSQEVFTMDQKQSLAVTKAFKQLFDAGLIYRANSLVNWSCSLQSAISDMEVDHKEIVKSTLLTVPGYSEPIEFGVLSNFAYKLCDEEGEIIVATTRIETMLGDVAIAVHPDDKRYKHMHGSFVWHPFRKERIPIISDTFVDPKFGTGAVKITPAHDYTDFEVGKKHNLNIISVITEDGKMNNNCGMFSNHLRFNTRRMVTEELDKLGLVRGSIGCSMQVPICSRSGDVIEYLIKPQWFINCRMMANLAIEAVKSGQLKIEPADYEKTWFSWLQNVRDWCVSRQLWWGHQVPMYHCKFHGDKYQSEWLAANSKTEALSIAIKKMNISKEFHHQLEIKQDEDVLDTWFSSALLPFSTFGWPSKTEDFKSHYPLSIMETGHDILFFWVARMVMLGTELTGQLPFNKILLHGIICDAQGKKMSKSLGNVIHPENVINGISLDELHKQASADHESGLTTKSDYKKILEMQRKQFPSGIPECGTDALRFTLCSHNIKNHFINFDVNECLTNRLFCNKIWQACKYIISVLENSPRTEAKLNVDEELGNFDRWILSRLSNMVSEINLNLQTSNLHTCTAALKQFLYYEFCDVYIESTKATLKSADNTIIQSTCKTLLLSFNVALRALSPFMPFVTEELYHHLPQQTEQESIMMAPYPLHKEWVEWRNIKLESDIEVVLAVIKSIRRLKKRYVPSKQKPKVYIVGTRMASSKGYIKQIKSMTGCGDVIIDLSVPDDVVDGSVMERVQTDCFVHVVTQGIVMTADEINVAKKRDKIFKELAKLTNTTSLDSYKKNASPYVQSLHANKILVLKEELKRIEVYQELHKHTE